MDGEDWNGVTSSQKEKEARNAMLREKRLRAEAPHRSNRTRDLAWFDQNYSEPLGPEVEYNRNHAQRYGAEEGMINGKHRRGRIEFPAGSARDLAHASYTESTLQRDRARKSYEKSAKRHKAEYDLLTEEEKAYYEHSADGLLPIQHADMSGRALDLADASWRNGSRRTDVEDEFEYAHHSLPEAVTHYKYARGAFEEHKKATTNYNRHERHRSSEIDDGQRDCYGREVTVGTRPHSRSRHHELPPPGHYSAYSTTPPKEEEEEEEEPGAVGNNIVPPRGHRHAGR